MHFYTVSNQERNSANCWRTLKMMSFDSKENAEVYSQHCLKEQKKAFDQSTAHRHINNSYFFILTFHTSHSFVVRHFPQQLQIRNV